MSNFPIRILRSAIQIGMPKPLALKELCIFVYLFIGVEYSLLHHFAFKFSCCSLLVQKKTCLLKELFSAHNTKSTTYMTRFLRLSSLASTSFSLVRLAKNNNTKGQRVLKHWTVQKVKMDLPYS